MPAICLIVPCYNEEQRLRFDDCRRTLQERDDTSFCFVDDGSSDGTYRVLEAFRAEHPDRVIVLRLERNSGKAEAVRQGVLHASATGRFAVLGYWDADMSTPLSELPLLVAALGDETSARSLALGSRMKRLGSVIDRKLSRHLMGRVFATCASVILRLPVYDSQCGAKLFRVGLTPVLFGSRFITQWLFDVELLARLQRHLGGDGIYRAAIEVPLTTWIEVGGSKLRMKHFMLVPLDLWRIHAHYNRNHGRSG